MPNTQAQTQHPPMTPDRAKAALGNATLLQSFLLPAHTAESKAAMNPQTQQNAPGQEKPEETPKEPPKEEKDPIKEMELVFTQKLDEIRQELKKDNQREIDTLKETITSALAEEDTNEPPKTA